MKRSSARHRREHPRGGQSRPKQGPREAPRPCRAPPPSRHHDLADLLRRQKLDRVTSGIDHPVPLAGQISGVNGFNAPDDHVQLSLHIGRPCAHIENVIRRKPHVLAVRRSCEKRKRLMRQPWSAILGERQRVTRRAGPRARRSCVRRGSSSARRCCWGRRRRRRLRQSDAPRAHRRGRLPSTARREPSW